MMHTMRHSSIKQTFSYKKFCSIFFSKLRMRWFFDVSEMKESSFLKSDSQLSGDKSDLLSRKFLINPQIKHLTTYCPKSPTKKINISPKENKFETFNVCNLLKFIFLWWNIHFLGRFYLPTAESDFIISCQNNVRSIMCYDIIFFKILKFLANVIISTLSLKVFKRVQNIFWKKNRKKFGSNELSSSKLLRYDII